MNCNTPTKDNQQKNCVFPGLIIRSHCVSDAASKQAVCDGGIFGWEQVALTADGWIQELERGRTIQPSAFSPLPDGSFSHKTQYWNSTRFVGADADNFRGVETLDDGSEKNPDGIDAWAELGGLSKRFPGIREKVYAVGESVSSMSSSKPPAHRRYRIIFLFDKPITSVEHYQQILLRLANEFPVIPSVERSPAQPVFGNAREDCGFKICGNVLSLQDYPFQPTKRPETPQAASKDAIPTQTLQDYLRVYRIEHTPAPDSHKFYVDCPYKEYHTGGKQGRTDSYVFDDGKWAFHCSHASCQASGRSTWEAFLIGYGIKKSEYKDSSRKPPAPVPEEEHDPVMAVDTEIQPPVFPDSEGEHFPGIFQDLYQAYAHSHVMPPASIMAMGIGAVGHCAGRRVIVKTSDVSSENVFLNNYTLLIGRSDLTAKSDTREALNGILKQVYRNDFYPVSDVQSIEGIIRAMENEQEEYQDENQAGDFNTRKGYLEGSRMFCMFDEVATLFANARRSGTKNLLSAINKLWKCPSSERVARAGGEQSVSYPVLNVWGNITPDQVLEYLVGLDMTGGTINRFMPFFITPKVETIRHPHAVADFYDQVVQRLQSISDSRQQRTLVFTPEADDERFDWYKNQRETHLQSEDDKGETRFATTAVKVAGIFALADNPEYDDTVKLCHWKDALAVTRYLIECYNFSFRDVGASQLSKLEHKILEVLNANGNEITLTYLRRKTQTVDTKTRHECLESLQQSGQIQTYEEATSGRKRKMIRRIA